jgi:phosphoglucosamine mutase
VKRLFGTDGIRGVAGQPPLDPASVRRAGVALARVLASRLSRAPRVVLGRDTRESGPRLRDDVAAGLASEGAIAVDAGVITTPGLACIVVGSHFDAGVMISASHNPFRDNGLKVFGADGLKLPDAQEIEIEALVLDAALADPGPAHRPTRADDALSRAYVEHLLRCVGHPERLSGMRVVLDCANGAASTIAPEVFRQLGVAVSVIGARPDGRNINLGCGSLHLEHLAAAVLAEAAQLGLAFDGDADRVLAVDRRGRPVDGDHILYIAARSLQRAGRLRGNAVVATIMSNFWLEQRLGAEGMRLYRAPVGDKYVLERMLAEDAALGGEQSGHVIFRDHATTGDGILTALLLLDALAEEQRPLDVLLDEIAPCPQVLRNVPVRVKPDLASHPAIGPAVARAERTLAGTGRVVLRYSGTEPLARVMVEGQDAELVRRLADELAATVRAELA